MNSPSAFEPGQSDDPDAFDRGPWVWAAVGGWAASAYWAALTLLLVAGVAYGSLSAVQLILPLVLIVLYAVRGYQAWQGSKKAARSLLLLHAIGGIFALYQGVTNRDALVMVLQGSKLLVHLFGGFTAWRATRARGRLLD